MSGDGVSGEYTVELRSDPRTSLEALGREVADWGGEWSPEGEDGGRLRLPVLAGLRYGWVEGPLAAERVGSGTRLVFRVEESVYRLQGLYVVVLLFAAIGALVCLATPFFPALAPALPVAVMLTLAAWLLIVARLRNSGPEELFDTLARRVRE